MAVVQPIARSLAADGPMLPTVIDGLPDRAGWVFEPKWYGWRCLAFVDDGRVDLRSRRAVDLDPYLLELTQTIHPLAGGGPSSTARSSSSAMADPTSTPSPGAWRRGA
jgi:ATP-dependent DNA ligase